MSHLKRELSQIQRMLKTKEMTLSRVMHENTELKQLNAKLTEAVNNQATEAISGPDSSSLRGATEISLSHTYFNQKLASWFQRSGSAAILGTVPTYSSPVLASTDGANDEVKSEKYDTTSKGRDSGLPSDRNRPVSGKFSSIQGSSALEDKIRALVGEGEEEEETEDDGDKEGEKKGGKEGVKDLELKKDNEVAKGVEKQSRGTRATLVRLQAPRG